jgi:hypothetical protein
MYKTKRLFSVVSQNREPASFVVLVELKLTTTLDVETTVITQNLRLSLSPHGRVSYKT